MTNAYKPGANLHSLLGQTNYAGLERRHSSCFAPRVRKKGSRPWDCSAQLSLVEGDR